MAFRLRPNLTSNLSLALSSAFIAFVLWIIAKEGQIDQRTVVADVIVAASPYADIEVRPAQVSLSVRFPLAEGRKISSQNFKIHIIASRLGDPLAWAGIDKPQEQPVNLDLSMVTINDLPNTVQVFRIEPEHCVVSGKLHTIEASIQAQIVGKPAEGYRFSRAPTVDPERIVLAAAPDVLARLPRNAEGRAQLLASPVNIEGRKETFEERVELILPDNVRVPPDYERRATVLVPIEENSGQRTIADIRILPQFAGGGVRAQFQPQTVTVTIEGPLSTIGAIEAKDIVVAPKDALDETPGQERTVTLEARLQEALPRLTREQTRIIRVDPAEALARILPPE